MSVLASVPGSANFSIGKRVGLRIDSTFGGSGFTVPRGRAHLFGTMALSAGMKRLERNIFSSYMRTG